MKKKEYIVPSMEVFRMSTRQSLLAGSGEVLSIDTDDEWPLDDSNPLSPW